MPKSATFFHQRSREPLKLTILIPPVPKYSIVAFSYRPAYKNFGAVAQSLYSTTPKKK